MQLKQSQISVIIDYCIGSKSLVQSLVVKQDLNADLSAPYGKTKMKTSGWVNNNHCNIRSVSGNQHMRLAQIPIASIPLLTNSISLAVSSSTDYPTSVI